MNFANVLGYAIPPREVDEAPLEGTLDAEFTDVDGKMLPCRTTTLLGKPALVPSTNLPVVTAFWPVNVEYMVFPRTFTFQTLFCVIDKMAKVAAVERAKNYLWQTFFSLTRASIVPDTKGGVAEWAGSFLRFIVTLTRGIGGKFHNVLMNSGGEHRWVKTAVVRRRCDGVTTSSVLLRKPGLICQVTGHIRTREKLTSKRTFQIGNYVVWGIVGVDAHGCRRKNRP
jgi:hypothetical protein